MLRVNNNLDGAAGGLLTGSLDVTINVEIERDFERAALGLATVIGHKSGTFDPARLGTDINLDREIDLARSQRMDRGTGFALDLDDLFAFTPARHVLTFIRHLGKGFADVSFPQGNILFPI